VFIVFRAAQSVGQAAFQPPQIASGVHRDLLTGHVQRTGRSRRASKKGGPSVEGQELNPSFRLPGPVATDSLEFRAKSHTSEPISIFKTYSAHGLG
jgi:hypothetical protein